jgi:hypothetical protein
VRYSPALRGVLKIFGGVFLLEMAIVGAHLLLTGAQHDRWDPLMLAVPLVIGLIFATAKGLMHVRRSARDVPGAVTFDRYGFGVNGEGRVSWRLVTSAVLEQRVDWRWRFNLKDGRSILVEQTGYSTADWKDLAEQLTKRLKRRGIDVQVSSAGQG